MKCKTIPATLIVSVCLLLVFDKGSCCPPSWNRFGDQCYRIFDAEVTRFIARLMCRLEGSDLVSISNTSALDYLAQHVAQMDKFIFWVGLQRDVKTDKLEWFDGTTDVENQPWVKVPEAKEYAHDTADNLYTLGCFAYNGVLVEKQPCYASHGFICGHHVSKRKNYTLCHWDGEQEHSFIGETTGNCLFRTKAQTTKRKAEESCEEYKSTFVDFDMMIKDGLTAFYDSKVWSNDGSKYWTKFTFYGTNMFYSNGGVVPKEYPIPVVQGNGSCITVQFNVTDILETKFYQTDCGGMAYAVCSLATGGSALSSTTDKTTEESADVLMMDEAVVSCPEGYNWKTDRLSEYCYWETSFETDQLSWDDAEKYCKGYGGNLASFHSTDEEKIGLSFQYGSLAHDYWIGLSLDPDTETYKWNDGTPLDYSNWAPGHPNHRDKRLRCVAMQAQEKHWVSSLCGILSWFICKVPKRAYHPSPSLPISTPLESCEKGFFVEKSSWFFNGACYFPVVESFSWHRAKQYCENQGGTLVSIHSTEEIGFLLRLLYDSAMETNRVWIGLNTFGSDGSYQWTDWTAVDFIYFGTNDVRSALKQEKCANMNTRSGEWTVENCNAPLGSICKRLNDSSMTTIIPTTIDPKIGNCKQGWIAHYDRCYYVGGRREKDHVNWTEAVDICEKHGGYLTSIRDSRDQNFLSYLLQTLGDDAWIGLHDTIQAGRYYWLDNSDLQYTNWAPGEPSFFGIMEDCVKMVYDHLDSGVWKDDECHKKMGYICQNAKDPQLPTPPSERGVNCIHPEGWLKLDSMCFKMFESPRGWNEAEIACRKDGGHLVSVSDQTVKAVVSYLASEVNQPFYIGLKYDESSQTVRWLNGFPVTLSNWEKNEPSHMSEEACFASTSEGYWKKSNCYEKMPYVCQITAGKSRKKKQFTGKCPPSADLWIPGSSSYCYIVNNDFRSDWFTAILMCFRYGSHLISIHSMEELEDLRKLIKPGVRSIYIGLMKNKKGGFTWTDDSPVDFVNWDEDQPEYSLNQCVEMVTSTMKWRVVSCLGKKPYGCQDKKGTLVTEEQAAELAAEKLGLSTAGICAVIFTILVLVVLVVAAVLYRRKSSRGPQFRRQQRNHSVSFENALYNVGRSSMEFNENEESKS